MKLAARVKRLLTGSVGSLIKKLEDMAPEAVAAQAIEEIDDVKGEVRHELGKAEAEKHLTTTQLKRATKNLKDLEEQIDVALGEDREDLAEAAVEKQLDLENQIPILEESLRRDEDSIKELNSYIEALQSKKRDMRLELKEIRESKEIGSHELEIKVEQAEDAFAAITSRVGDTVDINQTKKLNELEDLTHKNRVKERLEKIKADREG
jgi:phage shock protein A